jgi:hypothetical protein
MKIKKNYITVYNEVDVFLDEFEDEQLLNELNKRGVSSVTKGTDSLLDQAKMEIVCEGLHKKSLDELEEFFR